MLGKDQPFPRLRTPRSTPAARAASAYAAASESTVSWALSPLGLGTTHSSAPASGSGWSPVVALGAENAARYAVTPRIATTAGRVLSTVASS